MCFRDKKSSTGNDAMSAGLNEKDYLATLRGLWDKAWPSGLPRSPNYLHGEVPLTEYLRAWAKQSPARAAVIFYGHVTTYADLDRRSNQLGHYLRKMGVGPEKLVGISVERSIDMVLAMVGILKAGGAYVPIDPAYPPDRLRFMAVPPRYATASTLKPSCSAALAMRRSSVASVASFRRAIARCSASGVRSIRSKRRT